MTNPKRTPWRDPRGVHRTNALEKIVEANDTIRVVAGTLRRVGARFDLHPELQEQIASGEIGWDELDKARRAARGKRELTPEEFAEANGRLERAMVALGEARRELLDASILEAS